MRCAIRISVLHCVVVACATAVEPAHDKRSYSWANPVPEEKLREMSTDRPDTTESPFTVDPGHVQLEMDFGSYTRDDSGGDRVTEWEAAPFNLRFGISSGFEAGFFIVPFRLEEEESRENPGVRRSGIGDVTLRAKWNFFGNDEGETALGLIADVKLPTASDDMDNGKLEGAIALPVAFALPGGWDGAAMTLIEAVYTDGREYRPVWSNTITAGHDLSDNMGAFVELTSSTGNGPHVATFNGGVTRRFGPNLQYDAGVNLGLSNAAADFGVFIGMARRF